MSSISSNPSEFLWEQKYRPQTLAEVIIPTSIREKIDSYIVEGRCPSFLFFSPSPGTGKTTTAKAIAKDVGCPMPLFINASLDNNIETIRAKVVQYATTTTVFANQKIKIVILDECLEENTDIQVFDSDGNITDVRIGDLKIGEKVNLPSFNMETGQIERDTAEVIKDREVEVFEVELEDGSTVLMTANHPLIIQERGEYVSRPISCGLKEGDSVVVSQELAKR